MKQMLPLEDLPRDPDKAVDQIIAFIGENIDRFYRGSMPNKTRMAALSEILMMLEYAVKKSSIAVIGNDENEMPPIIDIVGELKLAHEDHRNGAAVRHFLSLLSSRIRVSKLKAHFSDYGADPIFQLETNEIARISELCEDMRSQVISSSTLSTQHKRRILNRISQIEQEIYKKEGRLDVVLGGVVDIGDALGEFGERVKPLVDRINEIRRITQKKSKEYEQIPAPDEIKLLPAPDVAEPSESMADSEDC